MNIRDKNKMVFLGHVVRCGNSDSTTSEMYSETVYCRQTAQSLRTKRCANVPPLVRIIARLVETKAIHILPQKYGKDLIRPHSK
jgi:hypothetical protein